MHDKNESGGADEVLNESSCFINNDSLSAS